MGKVDLRGQHLADGFLEDETGSFDWSVPDEDVHAFWNEHERHIGTSLYGLLRMYHAMRVWENDDWLANEPRWSASTPRSGVTRTRSSTPPH